MLWFAGVVAAFLVTLACGSCVAGIVLDGAGVHTTLHPEDDRARPKHVVTIGNKIQNQDSCVFRGTPPPSFDLRKHNGDDEPEDYQLE
jgi:hypothetical protein